MEFGNGHARRWERLRLPQHRLKSRFPFFCRIVQSCLPFCFVPSIESLFINCILSPSKSTPRASKLEIRHSPFSLVQNPTSVRMASPALSTSSERTMVAEKDERSFMRHLSPFQLSRLVWSLSVSFALSICSVVYLIYQSVVDFIFTAVRQIPNFPTSLWEIEEMTNSPSLTALRPTCPWRETKRSNRHHRSWNHRNFLRCAFGFSWIRSRYF